MLRVKFSKNEPNTVPLVDLSSGHVFKTQHGQTAYMIVIPFNGINIPEHKIAAVSFDSGQIHLFDNKHPVVEVDGTIELSRVVIQGQRRLT